MRRLIVALLALFAVSAQAKVLITYDYVTTAQYTSTASPRLGVDRQVAAVCAVLDRFGASYKVYSPAIAKTEFCRLGAITFNLGTSGQFTESFDAVIHCGYNGTGASQFSGYQPDSLLINGNSLVPQLMLLDDQFSGEGGGAGAWTNGANRPTWVATNGYLTPGSGSPNHEGEGTTYTATGPECWFDIGYCGNVLKKASLPTGGLEVIVANGMNSVMNTIERTGAMTSNPDSVGRATQDTMKVWKLFNSSTGAANIVLATIQESYSVDSTNLAGSAVPNVGGGINWPVLLCAMAALDSASGGKVFESAKQPKIGFVITHGGDRSDRRSPSGILAADTTFLGQSCDSLASLNIPVVVAADPESLAIRAGDIAILKRIKNVRFSPFIRTGIDTLALPASGTTTRTSPVDAFGRFRNRTFIGDSVSHAVNGSDTSICTILAVGRRLLSNLGLPLSRTVIAPGFDISPYQMRNGNGQPWLFDSLMSAVSLAGFSTVVVRSQGRDSDPRYATNPLGWQSYEHKHYASARGPFSEMSILAFSPTPVWGSSRFIVQSVTDTIPPYCDVTCPGPSVVVAHEIRFWHAFFAPSGPQSPGSPFRPYQNVDPYDGVITGGYLLASNPHDVLYSQSRGSICVLPAQAFGGGNASKGYGYFNADDGTFPTRPGWLIFKHLANVVRAVNRIAGRNVMSLAFPENIDP